MTTPQQPRVRRKQKARRTKQLAEWRAKHPGEADKADKAAKAAAPAKKTPARKTAAK